MKAFKIIILSISFISLISANKSYSQSNDEIFTNKLSNKFNIENINNQSFFILLKILPYIKAGNYETAIANLKEHGISIDSSGKYRKMNNEVTDIVSDLKLLKTYINNSDINNTIDILTKIFPEQKPIQEPINNNIDTLTASTREIKDTTNITKYKLSILIDKIKIYDYCDGRQDFNYAGEFTSEIRIISNGKIIKLYQQNNLLEKKGDEDIILNESLIPLDINSLSNTYNEIKIEAYLYEWDENIPTKLYNYISLPINQWNNKFNENFQKYHLFLDKNNECKAGLYYQIKLDKIN